MITHTHEYAHPRTLTTSVITTGDIIINGKRGLDAFPGTDLEEQLVSNGIKTVVLGGLLTNCCVESTMRTAFEK